MDGVIAAGFIGRALAGQVLFWISYLHLPIGRSLQIGDGLWFFALDALLYVPTSQNLAHLGMKAILAYPSGGPSVAFVKALSTTMLLFGDAAATAVLLNLFSYLGTIAVIVHWSRREPRARIPAAVAICAISLSPAVFIWSLQPLKDTFFLFIVVAFVGACAAWQRALIAPPIRWRNVLAIAAAMFATLLCIAGIRWYFAIALLLAMFVFLLLIAAVSRMRKSVVFALSAVLIVLLSRAFLLGAGPYVPDTVVRGLSPWKRVAPAKVQATSSAPKGLLNEIERTRAGFEQAGGNTAIRVGGNLSHLDHALTKKEEPPPKQIAEAELPQPIQHEEVKRPPEPVQKNEPPAPQPLPMASEFHTPPVQTATTTTAPPATTTTSAPVVTPAPAVAAAAPPPPAPVARRDPAPPAGQTPATTASAKASATPPPAPVVKAKVVEQKPKPRHETKKVAEVKPAPAPAPKPAQQPQPQMQPLLVQRPAPAQFTKMAPAPPPEERAKSTTTRLLIGTASVVVPRTVGEWLGLYHIGGGHGMLWFTELDTLVFDGMLLWVLIVLTTRFSVSWRNPLVWFVALLIIFVGVPLAYTITNYGTLFRLRAMIYVALILTPLALASVPRREATEEPLRTN